jgi:cell division protein ZipA
MAELRWILLLAGLVFLAGLTAWEMRRPRQARRDALNPAERNDPPMGQMSDIESQSSVPAHAARVPVAPPLHVDLPPLEPPLVVSFDEPQPEIEASDEPTQLQPMTPIVEWPPEDQRQIISVRVVGASADRLSGRPLRQALAACGFVHGRFGIFHQPGTDGRALVSAANLTKPGSFDTTSMDFQRFRGLGLFAVLPGPLPPAAALDHLLDTAGDLAERLQARLQDEHGMPLDEQRLEAMARVVHEISNSALRAEPAA